MPARARVCARRRTARRSIGHPLGRSARPSPAAEVHSTALLVALRDLFFTSGDHAAEVRMVYAPGLIPDLIATAYGTAFRAAVEVAGGREASFTVVERSRTQTTFSGSWR